MGKISSLLLACVICSAQADGTAAPKPVNFGAKQVSRKIGRIVSVNELSVLNFSSQYRTAKAKLEEIAKKFATMSEASAKSMGRITQKVEGLRKKMSESAKTDLAKVANIGRELEKAEQERQALAIRYQKELNAVRAEGVKREGSLAKIAADMRIQMQQRLRQLVNESKASGKPEEEITAVLSFPMGTVLYLDPRCDLTNEVIKGIKPLPNQVAGQRA